MTSDWAIPRARPAMVVMGNEEKPPTTAAARIGMTMSERFSLLRLVIGTRKIAAKPPNAAPMAQLAMAMTSGEIPAPRRRSGSRRRPMWPTRIGCICTPTTVRP